MPLPAPHPPIDPATREREYSPSSAIGGHYAPFIAEYIARSAAARAALPVQRDLRYGAAPRATLDFFPAPPAGRRAGLLVYVHGGYWQELSKDESAFLAPAWHAAGFAHAVVGYTLAPAAAVPQIVAECRSAVAWLQQQSGPLGFDPADVVVAGSSAGGYLAAACALGAPFPLRGIVPVSGVFDVTPLIGTSINGALGLDAATAAALDLLVPGRRFPPAVVAWGEVETGEFKRQSRAFAAMLAADGTPCTTVEVPGRNHFDVILDLGDAGSPLFAAARALFADRRT
ncbi:MAG: alpha/beta hydrolase [Vicinamibacterales bacterium]